MEILKVRCYLHMLYTSLSTFTPSGFKAAHQVQDIIDQIAQCGEPDASYRPHRLSGEWADYWECHVAFDWLLIYQVTDVELYLYRTGTHSDLFG